MFPLATLLASTNGSTVAKNVGIWMSFQHSSKKMTSMFPKRCFAKGGNCNGIVSRIWWSFKLASSHHEVRILFCEAPGEVDSPLKTRKKCQSWVGILRCNKSPNGETSLDRLRQVISALHSFHIQLNMVKSLSFWNVQVSVHLPNSHQISFKSRSRISNDINTKTRSQTFLPHGFLGMSSLALFQLSKHAKS